MTRTRDGATTSRHLRWTAFETRIADGPPSLEPLEGQPRATLFIDAGGARIGIRLYTKDLAVPVSPLAEVSVRHIGIGRDRMIEIATGNREIYREFFGFCCAVADRIQLEHQAPARAISETLRAWAALIRAKPLLSVEAQVGLLGELLFMQRLAKAVGWREAVGAWRGPDAQEHDFTLSRVDAEVKTTRSEHRLHHIASLTQLVPKLKRPLLLISIQVTPSSGKGSASLADTVAATMARAMATVPDAVESLREQLRRLGWSDADAETYTQRYQLRAPLAAVPVDSLFPAVVPRTLQALPPAARARIEAVSYTINVDGLGVLDGTRHFGRLLSR